MIKPNWDNFRAKFNENPQANFEWFCYLLFCQEFKIPAGIFRYKNQSGIETDPISVGNEVIGWQAKFYDTKLSDNKADLIGMIEKGKKAYPSLTKIIFYTNREWGQGKRGSISKGKKENIKKSEGLEDSNDSKIKKVVDKKAIESGIEIVWRVASFFESPLVTVENERIAKHFFSLDESIFDLLEDKRRHTRNLLYKVHTDIDFNSQKIEIDRCALLDQLRESLNENQILIVSGEGGVGKTAIIKKFFELEEKSIPFYVFKANEFNSGNSNDLFHGHGLEDFSSSHHLEVRKVMVIDSAEKLLELTNTDFFKEFITVLVRDKWQIVFTTRNNYLADLNYDFIDLYKIRPGNFRINILNRDELRAIAYSNCFKLPEDGRLLELIKNPFYLNEYLRFYSDESIDYVNFKEKLWSRVIVKNKPAREQCFLAIAFQRASEGQFFVTATCETQILDALVADGIISYESAGYFITHDIYEEWALDKKIAVDYIRKLNNNGFFENIGESLPVRRSFRNWVSERLFLDDQSIRQFSAEIVRGETIPKFWKDELWIAVLLSDHSATFFNFFKGDLLGNDQKLLKRLTFLLQLACKEVDYDILKNLGISDSNLLSIRYVLTRPKGAGWQSAIHFIYENLDEIGVKNIHFILPVIHEWNQRIKKGETTQLSSLIALRYYQWTIEEDVYFSRGNEKDNILQTILYGAAMIKPELEEVFENVSKNKWNEHREPYFDLVKAILTGMDALPVWKALPEYVLQLADLFWFLPSQEKRERYSQMGVEEYFGLLNSYPDYIPASPYQVPIYWLLQSAPKKTIDFILDFTNKTTDCFAHSHFARYEIEEVDVFIEENKSVKQFICNRLWCSYRGTQVSTNLLSSIHMALERFLLEDFKGLDSKVLEYWLLHLLRNSNSASISAVVTSIVLANWEKMFDVAKVLFQTKSFFWFDMNRFLLDQQKKSSLISLRDSFGGLNFKNAIHEQDRIKACDDPHRKYHLETLALSYQVCKSDGLSEEDFKNRQQVLWDIFDKYYSQLPDEAQETDADLTWRLCLARMDRRKMKVTTEEKEGGIELSFTPEIDSKLTEHSEAALKKSSEPLKYLLLKLWASYKRDKDERSKQCGDYENNPKLALGETKEIIDRLNRDADENFRLINGAIPADVCSILLIDYFNHLSEVERVYCKDIILEYSQIPLLSHYRYQITDGTASAISALPIVFHNFPTDREIVKKILLLTLFNDYPLGLGEGSYSVFPSMAIHKLWNDYFDDMQALLIGYLLLKPKYEGLREKLRKENYEKRVYEIDEQKVREIFFIKYDQCLQKITKNTISLQDLNNVAQADLHILNTGFQLVPVGTANADHKQLVSSIVATFSTSLLSHDRNDRVDYSIRHAFLKGLAYFVLNAPSQDIPDYLKPFLDGFNNSESIANLFEQFILAEDRLNTYDNFWQVWNLFFERIINLCKDGDRSWNVEGIIKSYLFAKSPWKESAIDWHSFKDSNSQFFAEVANKMGHCPSTLYSLAKSLNGVASRYLNLGIAWLSGMLACNKELWTSTLEGDTIYYLESLVRRYSYAEREKIRRTKQLKVEVLIILDFLVEKGSVVGYLARENIL